MKVVALNTLALVVGLALGSAVNMALITIGPQLIPPPDGADVTTMEGLSETMHLFAPKHFLFPFLAHALGTLVGAYLAYLIASSRKQSMSFLVGGFFLVGGISSVFMLPSPIWFNASDLLLAYIPMAWLGIKLGEVTASK
ncbi:MAG: hypothetical protein AB8B86_11745 [Pseudomonadales bacterium]